MASAAGLEVQAPSRGVFETLSLKIKHAEGLEKVKVFGIAFFSALAAVFTAPVALRGVNVFERLVTYAYPEQKEARIIRESEEKAKNRHNGRAVQVSCEERSDSSILRLQFGTREVEVITGRNIIHSNASVIVNPANTHLGTSGNQGLNGEILRKGGNSYRKGHDALREQMNGRFRTGDAAILRSGEIANATQGMTQSVIVVAPPNRRGKSGSVTPEEKKQLFACYYNAFVLAAKEKHSSIAVPSLGTGINGFPPDIRAKVCQEAIQAYYSENPNSSLRIVIYARKPEKFGAFTKAPVSIDENTEIDDSWVEAEGGECNEEEAKKNLERSVNTEAGLLRQDQPCNSTLPKLYSAYLQKQHPKDAGKLYFAEGFVQEDLDASIAAIPEEAELIYIPLGTLGIGIQAAFTSQEKRQFAEKHCFSIAIVKPQGDEPGKIYYFEPKGYRFHEDLMTVEGLSVQTLYDKLAEKFPGYELVQEGGVQAFWNKKDCVVHVALRMEEHFKAVLDKRKPSAPQPVNSQVRNGVAGRIESLLPPIDGGSNRQGNVDLDEGFLE